MRKLQAKQGMRKSNCSPLQAIKPTWHLGWPRVDEALTC